MPAVLKKERRKIVVLGPATVVELVKFAPEGDGHTHINVYSKGRTELGRLLSNFSSAPVTVGRDGRFECVEAWWYWQSLRQYGIMLNSIRHLVGYAAKEEGKQFHRGKPTLPPSIDQLKAVYHSKVQMNPGIRSMLMACAVPFDHYYVYGGKRVDTEWRWTGILWGLVREELLH